MSNRDNDNRVDGAIDAIIRMSSGLASRNRLFSEDSPMEAPVGGFNRHAKLMSPNTRELVLKSRQQEIEAFAEDRGINPTIVFGIAEASMRLGRVPDLRQYGVSGDDLLAIKHFMAGEILNIAIEDKDIAAAIAQMVDLDEEIDEDSSLTLRLRLDKLARSGAKSLLKTDGEGQSQPIGYERALKAMSLQDWALLKSLVQDTATGKGAGRAYYDAIHAAPSMAESTGSSAAGAHMKIGSSFMTRPRSFINISKWEKAAEDQKVGNAPIRYGVDMQPTRQSVTEKADGWSVYPEWDPVWGMDPPTPEKTGMTREAAIRYADVRSAGRPLGRRFVAKPPGFEWKKAKTSSGSRKVEGTETPPLSAAILREDDDVAAVLSAHRKEKASRAHAEKLRGRARDLVGRHSPGITLDPSTEMGIQKAHRKALKAKARAARLGDEVLPAIKKLNARKSSKIESIGASVLRETRERERDDFAQPGGRSALRASSKRNPRNLPCPTCKQPNRLTPADRAKGYQCDRCAERDEGYGMGESVGASVLRGSSEPGEPTVTEDRKTRLPPGTPPPPPKWIDAPDRPHVQYPNPAFRAWFKALPDEVQRDLVGSKPRKPSK